MQRGGTGGAFCRGSGRSVARQRGRGCADAGHPAPPPTRSSTHPPTHPPECVGVDQHPRLALQAALAVGLLRQGDVYEGWRRGGMALTREALAAAGWRQAVWRGAAAAPGGTGWYCCRSQPHPFPPCQPHAQQTGFAGRCRGRHCTADPTCKECCEEEGEAAGGGETAFWETSAQAMRAQDERQPVQSPSARFPHPCHHPVLPCHLHQGSPILLVVVPGKKVGWEGGGGAGQRLQDGTLAQRSEAPACCAATASSAPPPAPCRSQLCEQVLELLAPLALRQDALSQLVLRRHPGGGLGRIGVLQPPARVLNT